MYHEVYKDSFMALCADDLDSDGPAVYGIEVYHSACRVYNVVYKWNMFKIFKSGNTHV